MAATKKEKRQGQMETLKKVFHYMKHYIPILILSIILLSHHLSKAEADSGYHYRSTDFVFSNPYRKSN